MFSPSRFEVTLSPLGALDLRESTDKCRCVDQQDVHRTGRIAFYSISGRTRQSRTVLRVHVPAVFNEVFSCVAVGALDLREPADKRRRVGNKTFIEQAASLSTAPAAARANRELFCVCMLS